MAANGMLRQPLLPTDDQPSSILVQSEDAADSNRTDNYQQPGGCGHASSDASWQAVTTALLSLQLGWGLWLMPSDYARLGWCANIVIALLAVLTAYSGTLYTRLFQAVPHAVLFPDIGQEAAGGWGRALVSLIIYSLDATRCVILHLAATQSLRHMLPASQQPPLWQCGLAVLVVAGILVQVRAMAEMSWVFMIGTSSQLMAVGIVVWELVSNPKPDAHTEWNAVTATEASQVAGAVALMNMVFAFGGQFAFTELLSTMKQPGHFPRAVLVCTAVMSALYAGLGAVGYWSRGDEVQEIVIFALPASPRARLAAGCILLQAIAQYLINVNVWAHNLLVIVSRVESKGQTVRCSVDHCGWRWLGTTLFIVSYSFAISISLPFFATLVGLVTSVTYLICAYALPAWFCLRLLPNLWLPERLLLMALIPTAFALSGLGLWGSVKSLINDISGGEGWGMPGIMGLAADIS